VLIVATDAPVRNGNSTPHLLRQVVEARGIALPGRDPLVCGISDGSPRPEAVPQLYRDAEHAIEIANGITRFGRVVSYDEIGTYRLLLQVGDERALTSFAEAILGPVIQYVATHKLALIHTRSVFLNHRESPKQGARRLHVHANTVAYRLQGGPTALK
jgi:PucR family transcriptional regulator, purine catabolism regulatory protein